MAESERARIDSLRDGEGLLGREAVGQILPYGDAFLFVDSISQLTEDGVVAHYQIPLSSPLVEAHFVHASIMPGVLLGEALAQAGMVLLRYCVAFEQETDMVVNAVTKARFKSIAVPGDRLDERVEIKVLNSLGARLSGRSYVGEREICQATFDVTFVPREELIRSVMQTN